MAQQQNRESTTGRPPTQAELAERELVRLTRAASDSDAFATHYVRTFWVPINVILSAQFRNTIDEIDRSLFIWFLLASAGKVRVDFYRWGAKAGCPATPLVMLCGAAVLDACEQLFIEYEDKLRGGGKTIVAKDEEIQSLSNAAVELARTMSIDAPEPGLLALARAKPRPSLPLCDQGREFVSRRELLPIGTLSTASVSSNRLKYQDPDRGSSGVWQSVEILWLLSLAFGSSAVLIAAQLSQVRSFPEVVEATDSTRHKPIRPVKVPIEISPDRPPPAPPSTPPEPEPAPTPQKVAHKQLVKEQAPGEAARPKQAKRNPVKKAPKASKPEKADIEPKEDPHDEGNGDDEAAVESSDFSSQKDAHGEANKNSGDEHGSIEGGERPADIKDGSAPQAPPGGPGGQQGETLNNVDLEPWEKVALARLNLAIDEVVTRDGVTIKRIRERSWTITIARRHAPNIEAAREHFRRVLQRLVDEL